MAVVFGSAEANEILEEDRVRGYTAITPDDELVDCPDCGGNGLRHIECGECGGWYDECEKCDNKGKITKEKFLKLE